MSPDVVTPSGGALFNRRTRKERRGSGLNVKQGGATFVNSYRRHAGDRYDDKRLCTDPFTDPFMAVRG